MYLLLDIGNTREKAALFDQGEIRTLSHLTADTLKTLPLAAVYFACVADDSRLSALQKRLALDHLPWHQISSQAKAFGVTNSYAEPQRLGVDRWLGLLAASRLYRGQSVMIVDAGTALTIDWLDKEGNHLGGWIMPGLRLQQQSVVQQTAKVFNTEPIDAQLLPGTETVSCLQNGCLAALTGAIRQGWLLEKAQVLVFTGGDAPSLISYLPDLDISPEPLLIFQGLARYIDQ
ncbi:type III pantothenate kinase [Arsukibacterium sp.]|uniref:type III pantothenate kinase n=1 Tax=Arsukibacterium sp. TaxID=1977258 RepID=UPI00299EE013|nr:type III pantothenate kinase [Arsukibacterium sp.]MDX1678895.1 type III pantothenate kinase [Arsukibacterium sp.]